MVQLIREPLGLKDSEAIMWCLGEIFDRPDREPTEAGDPLRALLDAGWPREAIMLAGPSMWAIADGDWLEEPMSDLQKDILRACVENSSWVAAYIQNGPAGGNEDDARRTLRNLAEKLETFGIECNFIAND